MEVTCLLLKGHLRMSLESHAWNGAAIRQLLKADTRLLEHGLQTQVRCSSLAGCEGSTAPSAPRTDHKPLVAGNGCQTRSHSRTRPDEQKELLADWLGSLRVAVPVDHVRPWQASGVLDNLAGILGCMDQQRLTNVGLGCHAHR